MRQHADVRYEAIVDALADRLRDFGSRLCKLEADEPTVSKTETVEPSADEVEKVARALQDTLIGKLDPTPKWLGWAMVAREHIRLRDEALAGTEVHGLTESLRAASKIGQEAVARAEKAELERDTLQKEIEAIRNAPQDYTQHEGFGECMKCEHRLVDHYEYPCALCSHAVDYIDGTSSNWRPRS